MFRDVKDLYDQNKYYLGYMKDPEESINEKDLNEYVENYLAKMFDEILHERTTKLFLSLTDPDQIKQSKFTKHEKTIKNSALEELLRQNIRRLCCCIFNRIVFSILRILKDPIWNNDNQI